MRNHLMPLAALAALAFAACGAPEAPRPTATPPATISPAPTLAPTATTAPLPTPQPPAAPAAIGAAAVPARLQPLNQDLCNTLAREMSAKLGGRAAQAAAIITDTARALTGVGCIATVTGTGERFANPGAAIDDLAAVLEANGWRADDALAAGGPTGAVAGFRKAGEVCLASAQWTPAPEVKCPADQPIASCQIAPAQKRYTIALNCAQGEQQADATAGAAGLPNPASEQCAKLGGSISILQRGDGGEYGLCTFEDNRQCEEWALLRGDCPAGGVSVAGYVTDAARYCAITGGSYAVTGAANTPQETGACTLKGGKVCDALAYFNGTCSR